MPAGPIYKLDEVFADPQVQHLGIAAPLHHPTRGNIRVVGQPVTLSAPRHVLFRLCRNWARTPMKSFTMLAIAMPKLLIFMPTR